MTAPVASVRVTIAIVSYNSGATLPRCLAALAAQTEHDFHVILIDNASRERPAALIEGLPFSVDYREMSENLGFAGGMNVALDACRTPLLAALNPDAFPDPGWLATLLRAADRYPHVAAFGSLQLAADDPSRIDGFGDHYLICGQAWRGRTRPPTHGDLAYSFGVCAAAALYRTGLLRRIGGFDERFFCFYEDVDVAFRLRLAGAECAVVPAAVVSHVGGASFEGLSDFAAFLIARNQWWVLVKNMPFALLWFALPGFVLLQLVGLVKHPGSARMKGLWAALTRTREFLKARRVVRRQRSPSASAGRWISWNPLAFLRKTSLVRGAPLHGENDRHVSSARDIQRAAAGYLRLLTDELAVSDDAVEVKGIVIPPPGAARKIAFFINGRKFDEVLYPLDDKRTRTRFTETEGAAGFAAVARRGVAALKAARFFRIDASPTGEFDPRDWRHAMWFMNPAYERFPMPPAGNMIRVVGDDSAVRFGMGGAILFHNVRALLAEMGRAWSDFPRILDWGCGAGRLTRYLISETDAEVHGADIDADSIEWCRKNLVGGRFHRLPLAPPTALPAGMFDLVIGGSVMTHLTEDMSFAWLAELRRVTRPGALLFLSIAGPVQFAYLGMPIALLQKGQETGLYDSHHDPILDAQIANASYYRSVWHGRWYVRDVWRQYFDVVAIESGIAALQDFVILRRRDDERAAES